MTFLLKYAVACMALVAACGSDEVSKKPIGRKDGQKHVILQRDGKVKRQSRLLPTKGVIAVDSAPNMCWTVQDANHAPGTPVVLAPCTGADHQLFTYTNSHLRVFLHKCLEVDKDIDQVGNKVVLAWCDPNNKYQQWGRDNRAWVWSAYGKCVDVPAANPVPGAALQIWSCNETGAQQFGDPKAYTAPPAPPPQPKPNSAFLPTVKGNCPPLQTGMQTFNGQQVQLWAADASHFGGSLVLYWHATGGNSGEAGWGFGTAQINDVVAKGGMVASFASSTGTGANLNGNHVWFGDDFYTADQVVACALRDLHIDPRRIYVTGASAGGLATTWMSYARSGYIAATAPLSGGMLGQSYGNWGDPTTSMQDPCSVPFAMVTHGGKGVDVYAPTNFDFAVSSSLYERNIAEKGGMSMDCNTGGGHVAGPPTIGPFVWQFFQAHPFKQTPEPYQGSVPAGFPSYCRIGPVTY